MQNVFRHIAHIPFHGMSLWTKLVFFHSDATMTEQFLPKRTNTIMFKTQVFPAPQEEVLIVISHR